MQIPTIQLNIQRFPVANSEKKGGQLSKNVGCRTLNNHAFLLLLSSSAKKKSSFTVPINNTHTNARKTVNFKKKTNNNLKFATYYRQMKMSQKIRTQNIALNYKRVLQFKFPRFKNNFSNIFAHPKDKPTLY